MPRRIRHLLPVLLAASITAATGAGQQVAPTEQPEQPVFRAKVDVVRVDVSVTGRRDEPVVDLQASDFIVTEDDVPQTVETAQLVRLDGQRHVDNGESLEIRGQAQAMVEAAKDDVRLFALFLDDYHIDKYPTVMIPLRRALENFVEQLQPTDLFVLMEPLTTLDGLRFTRNKAELIERIRTFEGRRGELFPVKSAVEEAQLSQRNVFELRAGVTLSALEALATRLGGIREGRKSILFVSQGPPVGTPGSPNYPRLDAALQAANRGNVTIHVLDPRPLGSAPFGGAEALRRLSAETGGRAIINSNSPERGVKDVFVDASAYYLVGYSPTRQQADGKFHRIDVRVKRSGVKVTARRGYWAPTEAELNPPPAPPEDAPLTEALRELVDSPEGRMIDMWVGTEPAEDGLSSAVHVTWEPAPRNRGDNPDTVEVEPVTRTGSTLGSPQTVRSPPRSGDVPTVASFQLQPGAAALKVTVRSPGGSVLDRWTQSLVVPSYASAALRLGTPRVFRARSLAEARAFEADPQPTPTASRRFRRTDRLVIDVPYTVQSGEPKIQASLTNRDGKVLAPLELAPGPTGVARVALPLASMAPSTYTVRVEVAAGADAGA
ncbi:MAG: VWA domain-containing protein, partial [Acidobacteriota bacterium]|nr:VWA domain-containing protein [Acidobacteriota bacterium]